VAARQQRHEQAFQQVVLADDDLLHLIEQALHGQVVAGVIG